MTTAAAIAEMMTAWNTIVAVARKQHPQANDEQIYQIAKSAMNHALKIA